MRVEPDMADDLPEETGPLPADLRFLKGLVTVLTAVMILGVIAIVALLVIRLNGAPRPVMLDPAGFAVPDGVGTVGYSVVDGLTVLVGDDGVIRVYDSDSRALVQEFVTGN
jgi:hypothetical protein